VLKPEEMKLVNPKVKTPEEGYHRSHHLARLTILLVREQDEGSLHYNVFLATQALILCT
jgi:hypothetical protein